MECEWIVCGLCVECGWSVVWVEYGVVVGGGRREGVEVKLGKRWMCSARNSVHFQKKG